MKPLRFYALIITTIFCSDATFAMESTTKEWRAALMQQQKKKQNQQKTDLFLIKAIKAGSPNTVRLHLANKANIYARDETSGKTALQLAYDSENVKIIGLMRAKVPRKKIVSFLQLLPPDIHALLERFIVDDVWREKEISDENGRTPLYITSKKGVDTLTALLLAMGADPDKTTTANGATSLVVAAENGHTPVVTLLLEAGADPHIATTAGSTPLHLAAEKNKITMAKYLLAHGASPRIKNNNGKLPEELTTNLNLRSLFIDAEIKSYTAEERFIISTIRRAVSIAEVLQAAHRCNNLELGARILRSKYTQEELNSALHDASEKGIDNDIILLLKAGSDVNAVTWFTRQTPLLRAIHYSQTRIAQLLLAAGANPNIPIDSSGQTPLHIAAAWNDNPDMIQLLLAHHADPNSKDHEGRTAADLARRPNVIRILTEAQEKFNAQAS